MVPLKNIGKITESVRHETDSGMFASKSAFFVFQGNFLKKDLSDPIFVHKRLDQLMVYGAALCEKVRLDF